MDFVEPGTGRCVKTVVAFFAVQDPLVRNGAVLECLQAQAEVVDTAEPAVGNEQGFRIKPADQIDHVVGLFHRHQHSSGPFDQADVAQRCHRFDGTVDSPPVDCGAVSGDEGGGRKFHLYGDDVIDIQRPGTRIKLLQFAQQEFSVGRDVFDACFDGFDYADADSPRGQGMHQFDGRIGFAYFRVRCRNKYGFCHLCLFGYNFRNSNTYGFKMNRFEVFATQFVQGAGAKEGAVSPAITGSAAFAYGDPETAEGIFDGSVKKPLYARVGNPTSGKLEGLLAQMEGGVGAIATSSGMAATTLAVMSLLESGDEIISIGGLFGGTYSFFSETLSRFGISTSFFDVDALEEAEAVINARTKLIYLESVGNPNMRLPDLDAVAAIAEAHGIALVVDNTVSPLSIQPLKLGADIVVYSTTKLIAGNASALGGAAVFRAVNEGRDKFKTPRYASIRKFVDKMGATALIAVGKKRAMRDFGMSPSAFNSYLTMLGLETLPLRMDRIVDSVEKVALALAAGGLDVNHPVLPQHPHHNRYETRFKNGSGPLLTIDMGTREAAYAFLRAAKLPTITANIGDSRTLALHMDSTIYSDFGKEERAFLGITPGLIRVSVGLENPDDIINDFIDASRNR